MREYSKKPAILVIGSGNMGKRHGAILTQFGCNVSYVDIEFRSDADGVSMFDALVIATPGPTHAKLIKELAPTNKPLFVEKPVIVGINDLMGVVLPKISMVACNWRYCECADPVGEIVSVYKATEEEAKLDFIHFYDWFVHKHGEPDLARYVQGQGAGRLSLLKDGTYFASNIIWDGALGPQTWYTPKLSKRQIHVYGPCPMFQYQMAEFLRCVKERVQSDNPIEVAAERTAKLIEVVSRPVTAEVAGREAPAPLTSKDLDLEQGSTSPRRRGPSAILNALRSWI